MNALGSFLKATLSFEKWHGARNDFVFVERSALLSALKPHTAGFESALCEFSRAVCQRNIGLGADGLVVWDFSTPRAGLSAGIWNSDGSRAGTCGNALRCLAALCFSRGLWNGREPCPVAELDCSSTGVQSSSPSAIFATLLESRCESLTNGLFESAVEMGEVFEARSVSTDTLRQAAFIGGTVAQELFLQSVQWTTFVQLANPHLVVGLTPGAFQKLTPEHFSELGALLQTQAVCQAVNIPLSNIGFLELPGREQAQADAAALPAVVFERGAGLTPCCGSGGCAMKVALDDKKLTASERPERFAMPGGVISISRDNAQGKTVLRLMGPAQCIVSGTMR